jgi:hypothetical protein
MSFQVTNLINISHHFLHHTLKKRNLFSISTLSVSKYIEFEPNYNLYNLIFIYNIINALT